MKAYLKLMDIVALIEEIVLAIATLMVLILTFGNVIARYVFSHSWGFTEEIVVAVFVLISMLAAGVAARTGDLVNLALIPDLVGPIAKKVLNVISTIICVIYSILLAWTGMGRVKADGTLSPILHIPKSIFWGFIVIGAIALVLHFIENCIVYCTSDLTEKKEEE